MKRVDIESVYARSHDDVSTFVYYGTESSDVSMGTMSLVASPDAGSNVSGQPATNLHWEVVADSADSGSSIIKTVCDALACIDIVVKDPTGNVIGKYKSSKFREAKNESTENTTKCV